ncbi:MAG: glycoside hydrolase family 57 protein [Vicinamibacterales bacterium]
MTRVAILWHMHQPYYEDLVTHEHILPWVRLHALKDYWGMATLLEEFPQMRTTFNLVPSLLVQLEAFAENRAQDRFLDVGLKPAHALTTDDVRFMLRNFFHAQRQRMIDAYPRYAELLALRGWGTSDADLAAAARRFAVDDLRDLQVWQKLAWIDPEYHATDARVRSLVERGRLFTEDDKLVLREVELELLRAVIPAYRHGADAGRIEISTSPFYHPILPLLCDTDIYKHTHPASRSPRRRFTRPEDALAQLEDAAAYHERLFGRRPVGLWPSEGSVSDAMVPLVARAGFRWMATDEMILANTLGTLFGRDGRGLVEQADRLYRPYLVSAGGAEVACGFRDHALSDLIGFVYAGWNPDAAAADFVGRLAEAGRHAAARNGGGEPTIFVILDGENAWEHFEGGGRPFLRALYGRLTGHPELRAVTMSEACAGPTERLEGIFPGSWIDANFSIWIGHQDDQRAWSQLADARAVLDDASGDVDAGTLARAREEILIAEGSDWCWWYGDDHSSDHDAEFDDLFRRHLRNVYRLLRRPIPDELFVSNISASATSAEAVPPTGLIAPVLDGENSSYFEWLGAGRLDVRDTAGAMHQAERAPSLLSVLHFGFSEEYLFLRLDAHRPATRWLAEGLTVVVSFLVPAQIRVVCGSRDGRLSASVERLRGDLWVSDGSAAVAASAGSILEIAVPRGVLADGPERVSDVSFFVALHDAESVEVERHPSGRPISVTLPDSAFAARNWTA